MPNPFKSIMNIRREELPIALLMFSYFFLVITSFWVLKPIKKAIFIQLYDKTGFELFNWAMTAAQAELLAKILNMFVAYLAVIAFTLVANKFRRQQLSYIFSTFFIVFYILFSLVMDQPSGSVVWSFYLFGDLFSTLMVATFFAFLNDSMTSDSSKRLYGIIGLGGVAGGAFGSSVVRAWIGSLPTATWLMICLGLALIIIVIAGIVGRLVRKIPTLEVDSKEENELEKKIENPALEGAKLVFKSKYLLAIVAIVGLYEIVSTVMDFQFTATISHYLDGPAIGKQMATVFTLTNWVAMFVQLFLTSFIMTRFGIKTALMILPVMAIVGSLGFMAIPILWVGSLLNTFDNGFSYSINQSAKESLYVPTTKDEKYKAKAFIDMFVQRFGKVLAIGVSLAITTIVTDFSSVRWLSIFTVLIVLIWFFAVFYAGNRVKELSGK